MAKPYKGMPLGGQPENLFQYEHMHPINYESTKIDNMIPGDLRNIMDKLKDIIEELDHISSNDENTKREAFNILKDFRENKLESHSYYTRDRIPVLNYDFVMGCLTKQNEWMPSIISNNKRKCEEATKIIDTECKTNMKSDKCTKAFKDQQEYCINIDEGKALQYEQDCALLRYAIGAIDVAKGYLKIASDDIGMVAGFPILTPNPKSPGKLRLMTENELLEKNKGMAFLSQIANEMLEVGYQHI
jgi:hypothetical protein